MRSFGASPWRFGAADYQGHTGRPLTGKPVHASWDDALFAAISQAGYALEEEAVAAPLLADLADGEAC